MGVGRGRLSARRRAHPHQTRAGQAAQHTPRSPLSQSRSEQGARAGQSTAIETVALRPYVDPLRALEGLRRFSGVLAHSLDASALLKQFLLLLREIIGVNRAVIFLRKPSGVLGDGPLAQDDRWLRSACAIGHDQSVLQHFALSLGAGIGGYLHRQGRILRAGSHEAQNSPRNFQGIPAPRRPGGHSHSRSRIVARCGRLR
ncbi:MAG: hypothetical protein WDN28_17710 [Chthoniobacter sp.]